jgi:uncharacterized protein YbaR (Trm112 family)
MLSKDLLELLACPKCKGELEYRPPAEGQAEVLICHACKLVYEVVEGIPNMLIEEAKPLQE